MLKNALKALGCAVLFATGNLFIANAQIAEEFECVDIASGKSYTPISGVTIQANQFTLPPLYNVPSPDDGYFNVRLPFDYEFNGTVRNEIWICVNGFITFAPPINLVQDRPEGLFQNLASTFQVDVAAPYWGDHYYRTAADLVNGYQPGSIKYGTVTETVGTDTRRAFVVEWNNIQINDENIKSSVGNFQVWLWESEDTNSKQGTIEFAYGSVGPSNGQVVGNVVETTGASIGIKGSNGDFVNGLQFDPNNSNDPIFCTRSKTTATYTDQWTPSNGTDKRIRLSANVIFRLEEAWGDGDADLSKAPNGRHAQFFLLQNRYVTMNDVREILKSVARSQPLDSVRRRNAYHADVNHDGRYFWRNLPVGSVPPREKVDIPIRSKFYQNDLPSEITTLNQIFYQADEQDAAWIVSYLNARTVQLPWIYDTVVNHQSNKVVSNLRFGDMNRLSENTIEVPVHLTADFDGALSTTLEFSGKVLNVEGNGFAEYFDNKVVFVADGEFDSNEPIFTVLLQNEGEIFASNVKLNGNFQDNLTNDVEESEFVALDASVAPNPVAETANFIVNLPSEGQYRLDIYDQKGTLVKNVFDMNLQAGKGLEFNWDTNSSNGTPVSEGLYIYRLQGNGLDITNTLIINR
ncbi:MAG: hypothetical protein Kapaf2KO_03510 [Candidatus Kapaibacteriales bacterium]